MYLFHTWGSLFLLLLMRRSVMLNDVKHLNRTDTLTFLTFGGICNAVVNAATGTTCQDIKDEVQSCPNCALSILFWLLTSPAFPRDRANVPQ